MLSVRGLTKRYGPLVALDGVAFDARPGEVHAVVGENGAGKSTLVGLLSGHLRPDEGAMELDGVPLPADPESVRERGVAFVQQHFALVPTFSADENLALPVAGSWWAPHRPKDRARAARAAAESVGWVIDPTARPVGTFDVGAQARLEIAKALAIDARVLLLDEPTAVFSPDEADELLGLARRWSREKNVAVVLIAHKLREVLAVADRITVLRHGRVVSTGPRDEYDAERLAREMVGERATPPAAVLAEKGEPVLMLDDLQVSAGECVAVVGVDGNGQGELARAAVAAVPGAGYVPQDRRREGLALPMDGAENLLLDRGLLARFRSRRRAAEALRGWIERLDVRPPRADLPAENFSGGNAQKLVLARALSVDSPLLVLHDPTRGLDLGAADRMRAAVLDAKRAGRAILLVTTDLDEGLFLGDRVFSISSGRTRPYAGAASLVGG